MSKHRVTVDVSEAAFLKLMAECQRRGLSDGRGKKYPMWRIVDEALQSFLPTPKPARAGRSEEEIANASRR